MINLDQERRKCKECKKRKPGCQDKCRRHAVIKEAEAKRNCRPGYQNTKTAGLESALRSVQMRKKRGRK